MNWIRANAWRAVAVLLGAFCLACCGWIVALLVQIHGAPIIGGGLKQRLAQCEGNLAAVLIAQHEAEILQAAVNEDEERRLAANAERGDLAHAEDLSRAENALHAYAVSHRIGAFGVRAEGDRGEAGQAFTAPEDRSAVLPTQMPDNSFVAISEPDLQACTAAAVYAVGAHNWAATLPRVEPKSLEAENQR